MYVIGDRAGAQAGFAISLSLLAITRTHHSDRRRLTGPPCTRPSRHRCQLPADHQLREVDLGSRGKDLEGGAGHPRGLIALTYRSFAQRFCATEQREASLFPER